MIVALGEKPMCTCVHDGPIILLANPEELESFGKGSPRRLHWFNGEKFTCKLVIQSMDEIATVGRASYRLIFVVLSKSKIKSFVDGN